MKVNFNRPTTAPNVTRYVLDTLRQQLSGDGNYTYKCSVLLESVLSVPKVLLTTSGTHALELAALLLRPQRAIVPTFTFPSTANAFLLHGAQVILVDIDRQTLNLDVGHALDHYREHDIIVPVHYAGIGCDMELLTHTRVVEDNAHGLFGQYQQRWLGTFGQLAALSFHETKNFTMGEGGALLINDPALIEPAEIIREKGTNRTQFRRGQIGKYEWVGPGSSYLPSDILAAYLYAQLEQWPVTQSKREVVWRRYWVGLLDWACESGIDLPYIPANCTQAYHMFYLLLPSRTQRDEFISYLAANSITACFHYIPLHLSPMGARLGYRPGQFPIAEEVAGRLVRLPFYTNMTLAESEYVMEIVKGFRA